MLKVMVVEDDIVARNRICSMVDWDELGLQIVAEASNGAEALKLAKRLKPRLVLADVSMPVMDGVSLCRELAKLDESIRLIMISSYSNYDFIRETFKNGAHDYLLKDDLTPELLTGILQDIKQKLAVESSEKKSASVQQRLSDILMGVAERTKPVDQILSAYRFPDMTGSFLLIVFRIYYYEYFIKDMDCGEQMMHSRSIVAFLEDIFSDVPHAVLWMGLGQIALLLPADKASKAYLQQKAEDAVKRVEACFSKYLDIKAQHGWTQFAKKDLLGAYRAVLGNMGGTQGNTKTLAFPHIMRIMDAVSQVDLNTCEFWLDEMFSELKKKGTDMWDMQPAVIYLLNLLDRVTGWQDLSSGVDGYIPGGIHHCSNPEEVREYIKRCFRAVLHVLEAAQCKCRSPHIKAAMAYIREHYRDNITLTLLASHVGVAPNYLSGHFSAETGMTFVEYLNRIRIEAAERLLQTMEYSVKEVYHQVGFNSYNYFFKVYKDIVGKSPVQKIKSNPI